MNDLLEQDLRDLLAEDANTLATAAAEQRLTSIDYRRGRRRPEKLRALAGTLLGAAATGGAVAAIVLSSGAAPAYAGWSAEPSVANATGTSSAIAECNSVITTDPTIPGNAFSSQPILTELRGLYTAVVDQTNGNVYACLANTTQSGSQINSAVSVVAYGSAGAAPGPDEISLPYSPTAVAGSGSGKAMKRALANLRNPQQRETPQQRDATLEQLHGAGRGPSILGTAGSDVSAVTITFANGETVDATVENGWYFAWWPWTSQATSIALTTNTGTVTSQLTAASPGNGVLNAADIAPTCEPGVSGCAFATDAGTNSATNASASGTGDTTSSPAQSTTTSAEPVTTATDATAAG